MCNKQTLQILHKNEFHFKSRHYFGQLDNLVMGTESLARFELYTLLYFLTLEMIKLNKAKIFELKNPL